MPVDTVDADVNIPAASEETYRSLFENMLNGFAYCRLLFVEGKPSDFIYLSVNAAFEKYTGLKNVVGKRVSEVIPGIGATDPKMFELFGRVAVTGKPETVELYVQALEMWFNISIYSPGAEHFIAVFDVITDRKRAEQTLYDQKEILRLLTEAIDDVFWMATPGFSRMEYVSPGYQRIWGRSCESLYAAPLSWAAPVHVFDRDMLRRVLASQGQNGFDIKYRIIHPDGEFRWIHHRRFPVRESGGHVIHLADIAADITRAVALDEQLRQSQKMEALGTFAGGIAHDFNNILTGILGFAQLAIGDAGNPELLADDIAQIKQAANRAKDLVRQILTYSRSIDVAKIPIDVVSLAREIHPLIRASVPARIHIEVQAKCPEAFVLGAAVNIHQLLVNLCLNGADAIGEEPGTIVISIEEVADRIRLEVFDNGDGIDEAVRERIFDPFFSTKASGKGSGLGLAVVKGIVDDMGGSIAVESLGDGTRFVILLPGCDEPSGTPAGLGEAAQRTGDESVRVLVVDDEKAVINLLSRFFSRFGWNVTVAASGAEALRHLKTEKRFHLVVTDHGMPDMTGLDLAQSVRAVLPRTPILLMSGQDAPPVEILKQSGVNEFVPKPIDLDELIVTIDKLMI